MGSGRMLAGVVIVASAVVCGSGCTMVRAEHGMGKHPQAQAPLPQSAGSAPLSTNVRPESPSLPWHLQRVDEAQSRIYLVADKEKCITPYAVSVKESVSSVRITVRGSKNQTPCTSEMTTLAGFVQLKRPLGNRLVLHGATDDL